MAPAMSWWVRPVEKETVAAIHGCGHADVAGWEYFLGWTRFNPTRDGAFTRISDPPLVWCHLKRINSILPCSGLAIGSETGEERDEIDSGTGVGAGLHPGAPSVQIPKQTQGPNESGRIATAPASVNAVHAVIQCSPAAKRENPLPATPPLPQINDQSELRRRQAATKSATPPPPRQNPPT